MAECALSGLDESGCAHCRGHLTTPQRRRHLIAIAARFTGWCGACESGIEPGDLIVRDGDAEAGYVHEGCAT